MGSIGVVDLATGIIYDAREVPRGKAGGDQSYSRNKRSIEAFIRYLRDYKKEGPCGSFITFGAGLGISDYCRFQASMERMLRQIKGPYVYCVELGAKGRKLHVHMITRDYQEIAGLRESWAICSGQKNVHVNIQAIPQELYNMGEEKISHANLAKYLAKYMSKAKEDLPGIRTFRTSKGLRRETQKFYQKEEFVLIMCKDLYEVRSGNSNDESNNISESASGQREGQSVDGGCPF